MSTSLVQLPTHALRIRKSGRGERHFSCLHGLVDTQDIWDRIAPGLETRGQLCVIDQRGHGESDAPPGPYSRVELAADVAGVLDAEEIGETILIGHSMGGVIAMETALQYPERVRGLVLLGSTSECVEKVSDWYERIAIAGEKDGIDGLRRSIYGAKSTKVIRGDALGIAHMTRMLRSLFATPLTSRLRDISCPVLVIVGEKDPMGPKASTIIHEALPPQLSDFVSLPERGHWIHLETPKELLAALDAWVDKHRL